MLGRSPSWRRWRRREKRRWRLTSSKYFLWMHQNIICLRCLCESFPSGWLYHKISLHALWAQCHIHSGEYEPRWKSKWKFLCLNLWLSLEVKVLVFFWGFSFTYFFSFEVPLLVTLATFLTYIHIDPVNNKITAEKVNNLCVQTIIVVIIVIMIIVVIINNFLIYNKKRCLLALPSSTSSAFPSSSSPLSFSELSRFLLHINLNYDWEDVFDVCS